MKAGKLFIVCGLIGLAVVLVALNRREHADAGLGTSAPKRSAPASPRPSAAPLPAAASGHASNPFDPVMLTRPGTAEAVRQAFPMLADDRWDDGRSFIEFDMASAMRLDQGDMFALVLPGQVGPVAARIESVDTFEGMRRWTGRFVGTDIQPNEFSLTLAADASYVAGNFSHGPEAFMLEAKDGAGWFTGGGVENGHLMQEEER